MTETFKATNRAYDAQEPPADCREVGHDWLLVCVRHIRSVGTDSTDEVRHYKCRRCPAESLET